MPAVGTGLTEQQVEELIKQALRRQIPDPVIKNVIKVSPAAYQGSQFFYTSRDDGTGEGYVANRFYIDTAEESQEDTLSGSGSPPATLIEFQALAWPVPVP
tara:strand:- start:58 stop:360 length:303 start_codon:yes stop_codon:yes gene_type:complete